MSQEQLKAFIAKVQAEKSLQEQLNAEGADVVAIAKSAGFSITTEDLKAHRQHRQNQTLSDEELESVAGGTAAYDLAAAYTPATPYTGLGAPSVDHTNC